MMRVVDTAALLKARPAPAGLSGALRLEAGQQDDASVHVTPRWDMATLPAVEPEAA